MNTLEQLRREVDELAQSTADAVKAVRGQGLALDKRLGRIESTLKDNPRVVSVPGTEDADFSWFRAALAITTKDWRGAGLEKEVFDETRKVYSRQMSAAIAEGRALSSDSPTGGEYLIPVQQAGPFIEKLRARQIVQQLGATMLNGLVGGEVPIPAQTGTATAAWLGGPNRAITASDPTFGKRTLRPKKLGAMTKVDNTLMRLGIPSAEALVTDDLAKVLGLAADIAYLYGTGASGQPLGVLYTPNVDGQIGTTPSVAIGTNGGDFTFDHALSLEGIVEDNNVDLSGKTGFAFHTKVKRVMKKERIAQFSGDTGGAYIVNPIMTDEQLRDMLGHEFGATTQLPIDLVKGSSSDCSPVIFGAWENLVVGTWATIELKASDVAGDNTGGAFSADQTWIRAIMETDCILRYTEAFAACLDARVVNA